MLCIRENTLVEFTRSHTRFDNSPFISSSAFIYTLPESLVMFSIAVIIIFSYLFLYVITMSSCIMLLNRTHAIINCMPNSNLFKLSQSNILLAVLILSIAKAQWQTSFIPLVFWKKLFWVSWSSQKCLNLISWLAIWMKQKDIEQSLYFNSPKQ